MAERVLIIDDDARLAAMVSDYLIAAGYAVDGSQAFTTGKAALDDKSGRGEVIRHHRGQSRIVVDYKNPLGHEVSRTSPY